MQGKLPDFKPHHRLAAARELLHRGFYDDRDEDSDDYYHDRRPSRRPSRRPQRTAKTTPRDRKDDTQNGWSSRIDLLVQTHYGSKDILDKIVENTVLGKIEFEDRKTFEDLADQQVEALVRQYGSTEAWFAAVEKFANAEATLEQLLSGSIDLDDTNANDGDTTTTTPTPDGATNTNDGDTNDDDDANTDEESRAPPDDPPPEDDEHRPNPAEPSIWDLKAANRVLDSTTQMEYHRSYW